MTSTLRPRCRPVGPADRIRLSDATLAATAGFLDGQPDFIIDATGRTRTVARLLNASG